METPEQRRARTGVDPGGQGYVSGQVPPGTPGAAPGTVPVGGTGQGPLSAIAALGAPPRGTQRSGDTTTVQGALAAPSGTTTVQSALSQPGPAPAPGTTPAGSTGTAPGYNPLGPLAGPVGNIPVVGGLVNNTLSTSTADLGPVHAAQNAAFGQAGNLGQERFDYRPGAAAAMDRVTLDTAQANETRARQQRALDALEAAAAGNVPSAAEIQLRDQAARNNASAFGQAAALRGRSPGSSFLTASRQNAANQAETNVAAAAARAAEMERARTALMGGLEGVRGQDIGTATTQAGLTQRGGEANLNAQLAADKLANDWRQSLLQGQLQALGIGTTAAVGGANAASANAKAENEGKQNFLSGLSGLLS